MLYAHGSDLCHELELRHAMANCFEALMGALLLDGGINVADKVFAVALFQDDLKMKEVSCKAFYNILIFYQYNLIRLGLGKYSTASFARTRTTR